MIIRRLSINPDFLICQIWPQAAGIRRSVQTYPEEEGQDHQEACPQARVHWVPMEKPGKLAENKFVSKRWLIVLLSGSHQENQALRAGRREKTQGTDDSVLNSYFSACYLLWNITGSKNFDLVNYSLIQKQLRGQLKQRALWKICQIVLRSKWNPCVEILETIIKDKQISRF